MGVGDPGSKCGEAVARMGHTAVTILGKWRGTKACHARRPPVSFVMSDRRISIDLGDGCEMLSQATPRSNWVSPSQIATRPCVYCEPPEVRHSGVRVGGWVVSFPAGYINLYGWVRGLRSSLVHCHSVGLPVAQFSTPAILLLGVVPGLRARNTIFSGWAGKPGCPRIFCGAAF